MKQASGPAGIARKRGDFCGGNIDFHRDLRKGDRFSVAYEMLFHQGRTVRAGRGSANARR